MPWTARDDRDARSDGLNLWVRERARKGFSFTVLNIQQNCFAKWGEDGVANMKDELNQIPLLMLIASRCLLGNEVREKIFGEFCTLFTEIKEGVNLVSSMLPYIPIPVNRRRDRARIKLTEIVSEILRSRKRCNHVEKDVLQKLMDSR